MSEPKITAERLNTFGTRLPHEVNISRFFEMRKYIGNESDSTAALWQEYTSYMSPEQVQALRTFFRDAGVIDDRDRPTPLYNIVTDMGGWEDRTARAMMMVNMCHNNPAFRWFAENIDPHKMYDRNDIKELLSKTGHIYEHADTIFDIYKHFLDSTTLGRTLDVDDNLNIGGFYVMGSPGVAAREIIYRDAWNMDGIDPDKHLSPYILNLGTAAVKLADALAVKESWEIANRLLILPDEIHNAADLGLSEEDVVRTFGSVSKAITLDEEVLKKLKDSPALYDEWKASRRIDLTGNTIKTSADVATLFSIYRHPNLEQTHHVYLDKDQKIVGHNLICSGLTAKCQIFGTSEKVPFERDVNIIAERMRRLGAESFMFIHNHPSGDPTPSNADINLTKNMAKAMSDRGLGFHGHIVLNHDRFSYITTSLRHNTVDYNIKTLPYDGGKKFAEQERMVSPNDVAERCAFFRSPTKPVVLFVVNHNCTILGSVPLTEKGLHNESIKQHVRKHHGDGAIVATFDKDIYKRACELVVEGGKMAPPGKSSVFMDVIHVDDAMRYISARADEGQIPANYFNYNGISDLSHKPMVWEGGVVDYSEIMSEYKAISRKMVERTSESVRSIADNIGLDINNDKDFDLYSRVVHYQQICDANKLHVSANNACGTLRLREELSERLPEYAKLFEERFGRRVPAQCTVSKNSLSVKSAAAEFQMDRHRPIIWDNFVQKYEHVKKLHEYLCKQAPEAADKIFIPQKYLEQIEKKWPDYKETVDAMEKLYDDAVKCVRGIETHGLRERSDKLSEPVLHRLDAVENQYNELRSAKWITSVERKATRLDFMVDDLRQTCDMAIIRTLDNMDKVEDYLKTVHRFKLNTEVKTLADALISTERASPSSICRAVTDTLKNSAKHVWNTDVVDGKVVSAAYTKNDNVEHGDIVIGLDKASNTYSISQLNTTGTENVIVPPGKVNDFSVAKRVAELHVSNENVFLDLSTLATIKPDVTTSAEKIVNQDPKNSSPSIV